jgi:lipoate-protein ligase A
MQFIDNEGIHDPSLNLAIEEYALRHLPEDNDYLLFYINEPSIIIGRNQNTHEEINAEYVRDHGLHVVRRLSGGGAVYHDLGNLNYSFITKDDGQSFHNYRKFTEPVVTALRRLGVEAELTGRNDIQVGERKISGNAQFATKGRMFTHGTLLFDSELDNVSSALHADPGKIQSKGIKSIRSRVANIAEFLPRPMTIGEFRTALLESIFAGADLDSIPQYRLTERDWDAIRMLADERYRNWDWNYGKSPQANVRHQKRFEGAGTIDFRLELEQGRIRSIRVFGDFFGTADIGSLEELLTGIRYERNAVEAALANTDTAPYFGRVEKGEVLDLLLLGV